MDVPILQVQVFSHFGASTQVTLTMWEMLVLLVFSKYKGFIYIAVITQYAYHIFLSSFYLWHTIDSTLFIQVCQPVPPIATAALQKDALSYFHIFTSFCNVFGMFLFNLLDAVRIIALNFCVYFFNPFMFIHLFSVFQLVKNTMSSNLSNVV